jgi:phosphoribosylformimino-5-aminoimidazole carboxamide ribotide isomerase
MPFQVIPVIDLLNGQAVHAIGGRRAYYQPIQSILHASTEPISLAHALRHSLGLRTVYVADLDAIVGGTPNVEIYRTIIARGSHLWIDAGVVDIESAAPLLAFDQSQCTIIVGLETVHGPRALAEIVKRAGGDRVVFSLDLFQGRPRIAPPADWGTELPLDLAGAAVACGVRHLLILDLAQVGTGRGPGTIRLMEQVQERHRSVMLIVGGGIARIEEVLSLRDAGAAAVLVGSAIHHGHIGVRELDQLESPSS